MSKAILVVEDDVHMAEVLRQGFEQTGHPVAVAHDGGDGLHLAVEREFGVIVLDVMLPVLDGVQVATELRRRGNQTPILMLTARDFESDVIRGLDAGAEDYMTKPFSFLELSARIRALMRRRQPATMRFHVADLVLDAGAHSVTRGGTELSLSRTQYRVLEVLMRAAGQVVRRRELIDEVWGRDAWVEDNTLDVAIGSLRALVDKGHARRLIRTVRGFGYRIETA
jgi:DNA-binding response OmpR family regulator